MASGPVKSNLKEKTANWPRPKPERSGTEYNRKTKSPTPKVSIAGGHFD